MQARRIFISAAIGAFSGTLLFLSIHDLRNPGLNEIFILSGTPTASFLLWALPDSFVYGLFPEGGGPAAIFVFVFSAWLQSMLFFALLAHGFLCGHSMKQGTFFPMVYVKIYKDRLVLRHLQKNLDLEARADPPYTTPRLLVGQFDTADRLLKDTFRHILHKTWLSPSPLILMHPMEMVEGGLSQVEERVIHELGYGVGGNKVVLHVGDTLSDAEVRARLLEG